MVIRSTFVAISTIRSFLSRRAALASLVSAGSGAIRRRCTSFKVFVASSSGNGDFSAVLSDSVLPGLLSPTVALAGLSMDAVIALTDFPGEGVSSAVWISWGRFSEAFAGVSETPL